MQAPTGLIGGDLSHEFHVTAPIGEDTVITCPRYVCTRHQHPDAVMLCFWIISSYSLCRCIYYITFSDLCIDDCLVFGDCYVTFSDLCVKHI